jgi:DNA-binding NarL/FixJ family response regulator
MKKTTVRIFLALAATLLAAGPAAASEQDDQQFGLPAPELLTPREADVLELLQEGRTNAEIAHTLSIGIETVRTHARNIYRKLGIASRRDLASLSRAAKA